jgi:hypothetical protein
MTFTQRSYVAANSSAQTSCERHFDQLTDDELVERNDRLRQGDLFGRTAIV